MQKQFLKELEREKIHQQIRDRVKHWFIKKLKIKPGIKHLKIFFNSKELAKKLQETEILLDESKKVSNLQTEQNERLKREQEDLRLAKYLQEQEMANAKNGQVSFDSVNFN